ncbi:MAG TPA: hypothetical protein VGF56_13590 [Rhizomicrobium sp.]|jgi:uncharacterized protein YjeT (DUF2065 family)
MFSRWILALLGLVHLANGLTMLLAPETWYGMVPGVTEAGPFNHHFIVDIGLAFLASGAGLTMALRDGRIAATLAFAGSVWPALHALFHIWGWFMGHLPHTAEMWLSEAVGVVFVSLLGLTLAWRNLAQGDAR